MAAKVVRRRGDRPSLAELTPERLNVKVHNACEREDEDRGDSPVESLREVAELARHEADGDDRAPHHEPTRIPATMARPHRHLQIGEEPVLATTSLPS